MAWLREFRKREVLWNCVCCVLFVLASCQTSPPSSQYQPQDVQDVDPPVLQEYSPTSLSGDLPLTRVKITGTLVDSSDLVQVEIGQKLANLEKFETDSYRFESEVPLTTGKNVFLFKAVDSHGNVLQREIIYFNEAVKGHRLILIPERKEVPVGGNTFLEVFLEQDGQKKPLPPNELTFTVQQGYMEGTKYHASLYRGKDAITVQHLPTKSRETIEIDVKKPTLTGECRGPSQFFEGEVVSYTIKIQNNGHLEARNNSLVVKIPEGTSFKQADQNGKYIYRSKEISWKLDNIDVRASELFKFSLCGNDVGQSTLAVSLHSCQEQIWTEVIPITVTGILEVQHRSLLQGISVGDTATFQVVFTTKQKVTDIRCEYELAPQWILISANFKMPKFQINLSSEGNKIATTPVEHFSPGETLLLEVVAQAKRAGKFQNTFEVSFRDQQGETRSIKNNAVVQVD